VVLAGLGFSEHRVRLATFAVWAVLALSDLGLPTVPRATRIGSCTAPAGKRTA
jgi:hypothetical protein